MDKAMAKGDIREERLLQIISVITQVAIPCRVLRHKLALRDRQATRGRREEERGLLDILVGARELNSWTEER